MLALVDANNFYATCESIFQPQWQNRPLVVLSNNDGCIVARSAEAKALGIPMGAPLHQWRDFCDEHGVIVCSSNYTLYGDMSRRMLAVLQDNCPHVESYSIDESFLNLQGFADPTQTGFRVRTEVKRRVKITCGVGIGKTKTLAKFANMIAKKHSYYGGVFNISEQPDYVVNALFEKYPVSEVWGVGRRITEKLNQMGINTVADFVAADPKYLRTHFSVVLEKTARELRGERCIQMEDIVADKQQIIASRSFGRVTNNPQDLISAVSNHATRAAEKLRQQQSVCQYVYVMIRTNPFRDRDPQYRRTTLIPLASPSDDTRVITRAALIGLKQIYRREFLYHKVGIMLTNISPKAQQQGDLFAQVEQPKSERLMATVDKLNSLFGTGTIRLASTDLSHDWRMRQSSSSPRYTTAWADLLCAECSF